MKKFRFSLVTASLLPLLFAACLFDSDGESLVSWLDDQGFPSSYLVQTVEIDDVKPSFYKVGFDSTPRINYYQGVLGAVNGMKHEWVLDFGFRDKSFFARFRADSAKEFRSGFLVLYPDSGFYAQAGFKDSLPLKETLSVRISWILDTGSGEKYLDSLGNVKDSVWRENLRAAWSRADFADTTLELRTAKLDSAIRLDLPNKFYESLTKIQDAAHLQIRISAPEASRLYRFYGPGETTVPFLRLRSYSTVKVSPAGDTVRSDSYKNIAPFRAAIISTSTETCSDCAILHGGVLESPPVEIPGKKKILETLSDFYGDKFPYTEGDGNDVRQAVVLAQLTMPCSSSKDGSELGFPVQVVASTFVDSNGTPIQSSEVYKLNKEYIKKYGHPNLVFLDGDTLGLQLTEGFRAFINQTGTGMKTQTVLRMGYSMLAPYDTLYYDHVTEKGDSVTIFMGYNTYSRYDFTDYIEQPMSIKLWLATKRSEEP